MATKGAEAGTQTVHKVPTRLRKRAADTFLAVLSTLDVDVMLAVIDEECLKTLEIIQLSQGPRLQRRFARIFLDQINLGILRHTGQAAVPPIEEEREKYKGSFHVLGPIGELIEDLGDKANAVVVMWEILHEEQVAMMKRLNGQPTKEMAAMACVVLLLAVNVWGCHEGGRIEMTLLVWALLMPAIYLLET